MSIIDIEQLLAPIGGEYPCGQDLFDDPRYYAVQQAMQGQPERQMGDSVIAEVPPNYASAVTGCLQLLGESKDLRLAVTLTDALLAREGHPGLADGLELIKGLIERHWERAHPALEEGDPLNRVVAIESLNEFRFTYRIRRTPLLGSSDFSQRDLALALGHEQPTAAEAAEGNLPTTGEFQELMRTASTEDLQGAAGAIERSLAAVEAIGKLMYEKGGSDALVRLDDAQDKLRLCLSPLKEALEQRGAEVGAAEPVAGPSAAAGAGPAPQALPATIQSRQQARQAIELAIRYFEANEPSHPAPILLRRAQDLLDKPFLDVIGGLFPNDAELLSRVRGLLQIPDEES